MKQLRALPESVFDIVEIDLRGVCGLKQTEPEFCHSLDQSGICLEIGGNCAGKRKFFPFRFDFEQELTVEMGFVSRETEIENHPCRDIVFCGFCPEFHFDRLSRNGGEVGRGDVGDVIRLFGQFETFFSAEEGGGGSNGKILRVGGGETVEIAAVFKIAGGEEIGFEIFGGKFVQSEIPHGDFSRRTGIDVAEQLEIGALFRCFEIEGERGVLRFSFPDEIAGCVFSVAGGFESDLGVDKTVGGVFGFEGQFE